MKAGYTFRIAGKLEFGSPKLPMIPEALVLNFVDDLDAKMQAIMSEFEKSAREGKAADEMTGKVWALDQRQLLNTHGWLKDSGSKQKRADESAASQEPDRRQPPMILLR